MNTPEQLHQKLTDFAAIVGAKVNITVDQIAATQHVLEQYAELTKALLASFAKGLEGAEIKLPEDFIAPL